MNELENVEAVEVGDAEVIANFVRILHTPAAIVDADGYVRQVNAAWSAITGPAAQNLLHLVATVDQHVVETFLAALTPDLCPDPCEVRLANGRWAQIQIQPFECVDADLWLCTATDIDDLKTRHDRLAERTVMQSDLLDASGDCIKLIDVKGNLIFMNEAGCTALGVKAETGFGQEWVRLLPEGSWASGEVALEQARAGEVARFAGRSQLPGQPVEAWDNLLTPMIDSTGRVISILVVSRNVSEETATREALRESQERLTMATAVGGLGIWDFDIRTDKLYCDDTWHTIMGRDPKNPIASMSEFQPMIHPEDVEHATEVPQTVASLMELGRDYTNTFRIVRPHGEERWVRSAACLIQDSSGNASRAIGFVVDITDSIRGQMALQEANQNLKRERAVLAQQSLEDALTGLPNRRALTAEIERIATHARRAKTSVSIAMIDLDFFKNYNDFYGHLEGDTVLKNFAACLAQVARDSDFVARYGGEEFVLILTDTTEPEPALRRLFDLLDETAMLHEKSPFGRVTISCGCATFVDTTDLEPETMLKAADQAMYEAKVAGRNRYVLG